MILKKLFSFILNYANNNLINVGSSKLQSKCMEFYSQKTSNGTEMKVVDVSGYLLGPYRTYKVDGWKLPVEFLIELGFPSVLNHIELVSMKYPPQEVNIFVGKDRDLLRRIATVRNLPKAEVVTINVPSSINGNVIKKEGKLISMQEDSIEDDWVRFVSIIITKGRRKIQKKQQRQVTMGNNVDSINYSPAEGSCILNSIQIYGKPATSAKDVLSKEMFRSMTLRSSL